MGWNQVFMLNKSLVAKCNFGRTNFVCVFERDFWGGKCQRAKGVFPTAKKSKQDFTLLYFGVKRCSTSSITKLNRTPILSLVQGDGLVLVASFNLQLKTLQEKGGRVTGAP